MHALTNADMPWTLWVWRGLWLVVVATVAVVVGERWWSK